MAAVAPPVTILYGSQTGCAAEYAEELERQAQRLRYAVQAMPIDDFPMVRLPKEKVVIFVVSTTGQGEMPENMRRAWRVLLRRNLPASLLASCHVAVCGLGDSGYRCYNYAAKKLFRRLGQLSASMLLPPAYGDDQHSLGPSGALDPWTVNLWKALAAAFPEPEQPAIPADVLLPLPFKLTLDKPGSQPLPSAVPTPASAPYSSRNPYLAPVLSNERLTAQEWSQDVRHIRFDLPSSMPHSPFDVLCVLPENSPADVSNLIEYLGMSGSDVVSAVSLSEGSGQASSGERKLAAMRLPATVREILTSHLDITGPPRRYFFSVMAHFAEAEHEQERLAYFGSAEGQDEMRWYCTKERRSVLEVLQDFPSLKGRVPFARLLETLPALQAREFSISSSWKMYPNEAHVTVAVVSFKTPLRRQKVGLCTSWMTGLQPGKAKARVWVKASSPLFAPPSDPTRPLVLVGPGTGIAPFRALVQERMHLKQQGIAVGPAVLYYGCRHAAQDWLYGKEMQEAQKAGALTAYRVAFSRDGGRKEGKTYVQHLLREDSERVVEALHDNNGMFFLSGSALQMPDGVREEVAEALVRHRGMQADEAEKYLQAMEKSHRYNTETWQ